VRETVFLTVHLSELRVNTAVLLKPQDSGQKHCLPFAPNLRLSVIDVYRLQRGFVGSDQIYNEL